MHADAPRCVTCYSRRKIRIVWSSGVRKLPVVSEVLGNAVSGNAGMSSSSSCCPPISLLRWPPKPQTGCCGPRSYTCIHFLAACVYGTSDTCPVVLEIHLLPTTPPIHYNHVLDPTRCPVHTSPHVSLPHTIVIFSAATLPLSHNVALHILTQSLHQSSPPSDATPRPSSKRRRRSTSLRLRRPGSRSAAGVGEGCSPRSLLGRLQHVVQL